jgi:hypothetical protein
VNPTLTVLLCLVLAGLVVAACSKSKKQLVGGLIYRDSKGRLVLVLTPMKRKRKK